MSAWQRRAACLFAAVLLAAALGACGKKGSLRPPDGEAANYTYPRTYPSTAKEEKPEREPEPTPAPPGSSAPEKLSPFPLPFERETSTTTYGTE